MNASPNKIHDLLLRGVISTHQTSLYSHKSPAIMRGQTHILLALGLATLVQAQSSVVTVYFLEPANRPSSASANYGAESFGASVVEAARNPLPDLEAGTS